MFLYKRERSKGDPRKPRTDKGEAVATSNQNELIDKLGTCSNPQEIMNVLADEDVELSDDQLEQIAGGRLVDWTVEQFMKVFGELFEGLFPEGFDPSTLWSNLPAGNTH